MSPELEASRNSGSVIVGRSESNIETLVGAASVCIFVAGT